MNIRVTSENCDQLLEILSQREHTQDQNLLFILHNWMLENSGDKPAFDNRLDKSLIKQYIEFLEKLKSKTVTP